MRCFHIPSVCIHVFWWVFAVRGAMAVDLASLADELVEVMLDGARAQCNLAVATVETASDAALYQLVCL